MCSPTLGTTNAINHNWHILIVYLKQFLYHFNVDAKLNLADKLLLLCSIQFKKLHLPLKKILIQRLTFKFLQCTFPSFL